MKSEVGPEGLSRRLRPSGLVSSRAVAESQDGQPDPGPVMDSPRRALGWAAGARRLRPPDGLGGWLGR